MDFIINFFEFIEAHPEVGPVAFVKLGAFLALCFFGLRYAFSKEKETYQNAFAKTGCHIAAQEASKKFVVPKKPYGIPMADHIRMVMMIKYNEDPSEVLEQISLVEGVAISMDIFSHQEEVVILGQVEDVVFKMAKYGSAIWRRVEKWEEIISDRLRDQLVIIDNLCGKEDKNHEFAFAFS